MISPVKGGNQQSIRRQNRGAVLRVILSRGPVSRLEINRVTGITAATISHIVDDLINNGYITEVGEDVRNKVGRRQIFLDIHPLNARVGAIDIRLKTITVAVTDLRAGVIDLISQPLPVDPDPYQSLVMAAGSFRELLIRNNLRTKEIIGIGVGAVGLVNYETGVNIRAASLGWRDIPIKSILAELLENRIVVDNNVRAMALGEKLIGLGKNIDNLILVHIGWGIGSGMIVKHELFRGSGYYAGEVGHMTVVPNGKLCDCGNLGCLETVASGAAIVAEARRLAGENPDSTLFSLAREDALSPLDILEAGQRGDRTALSLLNRSARYAGMAVANLINVFNPDMVILAGSLFYTGDLFVKMVQDVVQSRSYVASAMPKTQIISTSMGSHAGIQGAAALALDSFFLSEAV